MNNNFDELLNNAAKNGNLDKEVLKNAAQKGDAKTLLSSLPPEQQAKIKNILSNKSAMENILKNPQFKSLLEKLSQRNNNG